MLKIVHTPNTILTSPCKPVYVFDGGFKKLIKEMDETLEAQVDPQGVGLAAPQVGINQILFIIRPSPHAKTEVFANSRIVESASAPPSKTSARRKKKPSKLEGCLSIPGLWGPVTRAKKILVEYQDEMGVKKTVWFGGFKAVIIQHEIDHTNGVLFTQRVLEQGLQLYEEKDGKLKKLSY